MTKKNYGFYVPPSRLWAYGSALNRHDQGLALIIFADRRYVLNEDPPSWALTHMAKGGDCPPQFRSDLDWLKHTQFAVTITDRLDKRVRDCREEPTWPTRPDLRGASYAQLCEVAPNLRQQGWRHQLHAEKALAQAEEDDKYAGKTSTQILEEAMAERDRREAAGLPPEE